MNIVDTIRSILSAYDIDIDTADAIAQAAEESARHLLDQGWEGDGSDYDLGSYPGDVEALEEMLNEGRDVLQLGKRAATLDERIALEKCIRTHLDWSK